MTCCFSKYLHGVLKPEGKVNIGFETYPQLYKNNAAKELIM